MKQKRVRGSSYIAIATNDADTAGVHRIGDSIGVRRDGKIYIICGQDLLQHQVR